MLTRFFAVILTTMLSAGGLSNELKSWFCNRNSNNQPPTAGDTDLERFGACYLGDTDQKELYLTFDEGYENGFTEKILDVLLDKGVSAAFFVTKPYIKDNPELVARMVAEGHVVGNHTSRHKSSPGLTESEMIAELVTCADYFKMQTGVEMPPFFRPPMGEYSDRILSIAHSQGYHTIFWSFAYEDWKVDKQPGRDAAYKKVMANLHNGAILLLHAVSSSNAEALGDIIDSARALGYEFKSLFALPIIDNFGKGGILWNQ